MGNCSFASLVAPLIPENTLNISYLIESVEEKIVRCCIKKTFDFLGQIQSKYVLDVPRLKNIWIVIVRDLQVYSDLDPDLIEFAPGLGFKNFLSSI